MFGCCLLLLVFVQGVRTKLAGACVMNLTTILRAHSDNISMHVLLNEAHRVVQSSHLILRK